MSTVDEVGTVEALAQGGGLVARDVKVADGFLHRNEASLLALYTTGTSLRRQANTRVVARPAASGMVFGPTPQGVVMLLPPLPELPLFFFSMVPSCAGSALFFWQIVHHN